MKKVYLLRWFDSYDYYYGNGFHKFDEAATPTKRYDSEESAMRDLKELTRIYYQWPIIIEAAYIKIK